MAAPAYNETPKLGLQPPPGRQVKETRKQMYNRQLGALSLEYQSWVDHHRELAQHFLPRRGKFMCQWQWTNKGDKRHQKIIDGTPRFAARTLAAGMTAGCTSPARPWFRLTLPDPDLAEFGAVKEWLYDVELRMRDVLAKSNLYTALPVFYSELGVFCTSAMSALEDAKTVVRFYPQTIGSYFISQNSRLVVDTLYRPFQMTVRQLVMTYGYANCSKQVQQQWDTNNREAWIDVVHVLEPNYAANPNLLNNKNFPFTSCYYEKAGDPDDRLLREGGFIEHPYFVARWETIGEDVYGGMGPGMDALGDAKALQTQQKRKAQAIDKQVDPPMRASADLQNVQTSTMPGSITYVANVGGANGYAPAYEVKPDLQWMGADIKDMEERVDRAFYVDLFLMLANDDRSNVTAREVEERHEEKLLALGPVLERLNDEVFDPLIDRVFNIMLRRGMIPPAPPELAGAQLTVDYVSILAQAQKRLGISAIDEMTNYVGGVAKLDPSIMDKFDFDQAVDERGRMIGCPPKLIVPDDIVQKRRAVRQAQQQAMALAASAEPVAKVAGAVKDLSAADMSGDSALTRLAGQQPAQPGAPQQ